MNFCDTGLIKTVEMFFSREAPLKETQIIKSVIRYSFSVTQWNDNIKNFLMKFLFSQVPHFTHSHTHKHACTFSVSEPKQYKGSSPFYSNYLNVCATNKKHVSLLMVPIVLSLFSFISGNFMRTGGIQEKGNRIFFHVFTVHTNSYKIINLYIL